MVNLECTWLKSTCLKYVILYKVKTTLYDCYQAPQATWIGKMDDFFECKLDKSNPCVLFFSSKKDTTLVLRNALRLYMKYVHFGNEPFLEK